MKLVLLCLFSLVSLNAFAEGEAFSDMSKAVSKKTAERMAGQKAGPVKIIRGNQTGGSCKTASDCIVGCKTGETDVTCVSAKEGNASCVSGKTIPANNLQCTCLTSIYACGYAFP